MLTAKALSGGEWGEDISLPSRLKGMGIVASSPIWGRAEPRTKTNLTYLSGRHNTFLAEG